MTCYNVHYDTGLCVLYRYTSPNIHITRGNDKFNHFPRLFPNSTPPPSDSRARPITHYPRAMLRRLRNRHRLAGGEPGLKTFPVCKYICGLSNYGESIVRRYFTGLRDATFRIFGKFLRSRHTYTHTHIVVVRLTLKPTTWTCTLHAHTLTHNAYI